MNFVKTLVSAGALLASATMALADGHFKPAVIFDLGGKFDRSFNQASFEGATRFSEEFGVEFREFEIQSDAQREQALRRFAEQGNNPIGDRGHGLSWGSLWAPSATQRLRRR